MPLLSAVILASTTWKFLGEVHFIWYLSTIAHPLQPECLKGMFIMDSLSLSCFLDCCFGMLIGILLCGIPTSVGASMRNLSSLLHFVSPYGVLFIGDCHAAIFPLIERSIAKISISCQVGYT